MYIHIYVYIVKALNTPSDPLGCNWHRGLLLAALWPRDIYIYIYIYIYICTCIYIYIYIHTKIDNEHNSNNDSNTTNDNNSNNTNNNRGMCAGLFSPVPSLSPLLHPRIIISTLLTPGLGAMTARIFIKELIHFLWYA